MKSTFKHPKIYDDFLQLYRMYWEIHKHLPRPYKLTTGESILKEITECLRKVIIANQVNKQDVVDRKFAGNLLGEVRAALTVIRGFLTLGWNLKFIAHGPFLLITEKLDALDKQSASWQAWFRTKTLNHPGNPGD